MGVGDTTAWSYDYDLLSNGILIIYMKNKKITIYRGFYCPV